MALILFLFLFFTVPTTTEAQSQISFKMALQKMIERNPKLKVDQLSIQQAKEDSFASKWNFSPDLSLVGQHNRTRQDGNSAEANNLIFSSSTNLFQFGKDWLSLKMAQTDVRSSQINYQKNLLAFEKQAAKSLLSFILAQKEYEIYWQFHEVKKQVHEISKKRFKRGILSLYNLRKSEIDFYNSKSRLENSEINLVKAKENLHILLGHHLVQHRWPWMNNILNSKKINKLLSLKSGHQYEMRPDIRLSQMNMKKNAYSVKFFKANLFPSLDLKLNYGYQDFNNNHNRPYFTGLISLSVPLFSKFADYTSYKKSHYSHEKSLYEHTYLEREVRSEMKATKDNFKISLATLKKRKTSYAVAKKIYQQGAKLFRQGKISLNDLAQDEQRNLETKLLYMDGIENAHNFLIDFCHARGTSIFVCL